MIKKWGTFLLSQTNLRLVILAVMIVLPFNALAFPLMSERLREVASGLSTLDVTFAYTGPQALDRVDALGAAGRIQYLLIEWTADLLYPLAYTFLFSVLIGLSLRILKTGPAWQRWVYWPLIGMLVDYGENISVSLLMGAYPARPLALAWGAAAFSLLKWVTFSITLLLTIGLLIACLVQFVRTVRNNGAS